MLSSLKRKHSTRKRKSRKKLGFLILERRQLMAADMGCSAAPLDVSVDKPIAEVVEADKPIPPAKTEHILLGRQFSDAQAAGANPMDLKRGIEGANAAAAKLGKIGIFGRYGESIAEAHSSNAEVDEAFASYANGGSEAQTEQSESGKSKGNSNGPIAFIAIR
jgi:hypothetical protein